MCQRIFVPEITPWIVIIYSGSFNFKTILKKSLLKIICRFTNVHERDLNIFEYPFASCLK